MLLPDDEEPELLELLLEELLLLLELLPDELLLFPPKIFLSMLPELLLFELLFLGAV